MDSEPPSTRSGLAGSAMPELILASESPRRASLMRQAGYKFTILPPPLAEPAKFGRRLSPIDLAQALSYFKARSVAAGLSRGWVLGGDTIVTLEGRVFGKPKDRSDAQAILSSLVGTTHHVITGVSLLDAESGKRQVRYERTAVVMREIPHEQLEAYLDTNAWKGKAGAYGIQDHDDPFVETIDGDYSNVVGFPMQVVRQMLVEWGMPTTDTKS